MEGVWTRFFPLVYKFQELLHKEKVIGNVHNCLVDFGMGAFYTADESHRLFNPELAGGAQLDVGPYTILWVSSVLAKTSNMVHLTNTRNRRVYWLCMSTRTMRENRPRISLLPLYRTLAQASTCSRLLSWISRR